MGQVHFDATNSKHCHLSRAAAEVAVSAARGGDGGLNSTLGLISATSSSQKSSPFVVPALAGMVAPLWIQFRLKPVLRTTTLLAWIAGLLLMFSWANNLTAQVTVEVEVLAEAIAGEVEDVEVFAEEVAEGEWGVGLPADPQTAKTRAHLAIQRALVRRVCKLSDAQEKEIESMDNKWLAKVSKEKDVQPGAIQQPGLIGMFFGVRPQQPQTVKKQNVIKRIDEKVLGLLSEEQKAAYDKEKEAQSDFRNAATADALIETLQDRLDLTDDQRSKIKEKLIPWVKRNPNLITVHYFSGNNYYPEIPLHLMAALTDEQRKAYQGLQRYLFNDENFQDGNQPIVIKE